MHKRLFLGAVALAVGALAGTGLMAQDHRCRIGQVHPQTGPYACTGKLIDAAVKAGKGGDALLAAMKGRIFEGPRGPTFIDARTCDVVHNICIRKVEEVNGQRFNAGFETIRDAKVPGKST